MTSSFDNFGNVVGTPRDKLPDISDTNYLRTEADLTEAVNKEIDENIKDTKEFYDDMMKIEENRYKTRDKSCLLYTSPSPRDGLLSRMPSSA